MKPFILFVLLIFTIRSKGQDSLQFRLQQWVGHLEGSNGSAFQFTSIAGLQRGADYLGIGSGIDWYYFRSVPLFLTYQRKLPLGKGRFFLNADAGYNFNWAPASVRSRWNDFVSDKFIPSTYLETGLNYKTFFKNKRDALMFHLGYGFKRLKEDKELPGTCFIPPCPTYVEHYDYKMNRLSIKVGWEF